MLISHSHLLWWTTVSALLAGCLDTLGTDDTLPQELVSEQPDQSTAATAASAHESCSPTACQTVSPSDALVTDFEDLSDDGVFVDNDHFSAPNQQWWLGFYGSTYVYPDAPAALSQTTAGVWHVTGTVADWSGFGLWLGACEVNLSEYSGISFRIGGNAGPSDRIQLIVDTGPDSPPESCRTNVGSCDPDATDCVSPSTSVNVPSTPTTVTIPFSELQGGRPLASPDVSEILQIRFAFEWYDWAGQRSTPYPVDVTIDDVTLVP